VEWIKPTQFNIPLAFFMRMRSGSQKVLRPSEVTQLAFVKEAVAPESTSAHNHCLYPEGVVIVAFT
jgi:hypothetical protein